MAAGITHTLTRNCSKGDFADCVCDTTVKMSEFEGSGESGFKIRGCSDNVHFGNHVAQQFLGKYIWVISEICTINRENVTVKNQKILQKK